MASTVQNVTDENLANDMNESILDENQSTVGTSNLLLLSLIF